MQMQTKAVNLSGEFIWFTKRQEKCRILVRRQFCEELGQVLKSTRWKYKAICSEKSKDWV